MIKRHGMMNEDIYLIGDPHLGKAIYGDGGETTLKNFKETIQRVISWRPRYLIILGDLFDIPNPPFNVIKEFYNTIKNINTKVTSIYILCGNHDQLKLLKNMTVFELMKNITDLDIKFITEPTNLKTDKENVWLIPYLNTKESIEQVNQIQETHTYIVMCHPEYSHLELPFFQQSKKIYAGHFHKSVSDDPRYPNTVFVGSLTPLNHTEQLEDEDYFVKVSLKDFVETPQDYEGKFVTLIVDEMDDISFLNSLDINYKIEYTEPENRNLDNMVKSTEITDSLHLLNEKLQSESLYELFKEITTE